MVDGRISCRKSHILGAEFLAECHPLFVHQSLDGAGVNAAAPMCQTVKMEGQGHHGFSGARGRVQDDVFAVQKFKNRFFLSGVERCAAGFRPCHERIQQGLGAFAGVKWGLGQEFFQCFAGVFTHKAKDRYLWRSLFF